MSASPCRGGYTQGPLSTRDLLPEAHKDEDLRMSPGMVKIQIIVHYGRSSEVEHKFSLPKLSRTGFTFRLGPVFRPSPGAPHSRVDLSVCPKGGGNADGPTQKVDSFLKGAMCGWQAIIGHPESDGTCQYSGLSRDHLEPLPVTRIWVVYGHCGPWWVGFPHVLEAWNSARASLAPVRLDRGSHVFSSCPYPKPFYQVKRFLPSFPGI